MDVRLAVGLGVALWAVASVLFIAFGSHLPAPDSLAIVPTLGALLAGTGLGMMAIARRYRLLSGLSGAEAGLALGAVVAAVGLTLDGALVLVFGFDLPRLGANKTDSLVAYLLFAYPLVILVPWLTESRRAR